MEEMKSYEGLVDLAMHIILSKLDQNDTARVCCVSKNSRSWASDDAFWATHCSNDLNLSSPVDPLGNSAPSFKVAYQLWRESFSMYSWPLVKRVKRCWDVLESWLGNNFPEVLATLRRGASEEELNEVEKSLRVKLPLPTRLIYRFHDGQDCLNRLFGLIGGYPMYQHVINVHLLPLSQVVMITNQMLCDGLRTSGKYVIVAASLTRKIKFFLLNCADNQLYVGTSNFKREGEMLPCVPNEVLKSIDHQQSDGVLLWLEEHGRRLHSGVVTVREEGDMKSISQHSEKPPLCSTSVTNGVQVRASAVFVPEYSDLQSPRFVFTCSMCMSLLPDGCTVHGMTYNSCRLYWKHLVVWHDGFVGGDFDGGAQIGENRLLRPGEKELVCRICANLQTTRGYIEGSLTFIPGSYFMSGVSCSALIQ